MTRAEAAAFFHRFMDQPRVVAVSAAGDEPAACVDDYADVLMAVGLSDAEARCVAPYLVHLDLDDVVAILAGERELDGSLIELFSEILAAGCVPTVDRQAALIRALL